MRLRYFLSYPTSPNDYSPEVEITDYIIEQSSSSITQTLSNNEYDVGTLKFSKFEAKLINSDSLFSEAENQRSIFTYRRELSILRITWEANEHGLSCGSVPCGYAYLSKPVEIYRGLLDDKSSKFDDKSRVQTFVFLGMESIIGKVQANFSSLIPGQDVSEAIYTLLNQSQITKYLTVDPLNINVDYDFPVDSFDDAEDKTVLEVVEELLYLSNSVLYVQGTTIFTKSQDIGLDSVATFYSRTSTSGIENIIDMVNYTTGENRTFNQWKWEDTVIKLFFADSIERNGFKPKEISSNYVTNPTTQNNILSGLLSEYGFPKIELEIITPMYTQFVKNVFLLDKVNLDIPIELSPPEDGSLPSIYGQAKYGTARYVGSNSSIVISANRNWKVMSREISLKNRNLKFRLREE